MLSQHAGHTSGLDSAQVDDLYARAHAHAPAAVVDPAVWDAWCSRHSLAALEGDAPDTDSALEISAGFQALRHSPPTDPRAQHACVDFDALQQRATTALRRQTASIAAMRGVDPDEAAERIAAFRRQYAEEFAALHDTSLRPDPPTQWVQGFSRKDMTSAGAPRDPATLYAVYRAQADPEAFVSAPRRYAVVDLETAGPPGKEGFAPENGSIIEVGVVTYDERGTEVDRYSSMVAPLPGAEDTYRTGAVSVHGITWDDVADAPEWREVAPRLAERLRGAVLVAQNDQFERSWLGHHLTRAGVPFDRHAPGVDTMRLAQQHLGLSNHRLQTICAALDVEYTRGHRALHDAEAAGRAFFAMRRRIHDEWSASPVHHDLDHPPTLDVDELAPYERFPRRRGEEDAWTR